MIHFKKLYILLFILIKSVSLFSQDLLDYQNSLKYAEYLYKTSQFRLAANEFERVVFLNAADTVAKLKLVRSYRFLGDYSTAIKKMDEFYSWKVENIQKLFIREYIMDLILNEKTNQASVLVKSNRFMVESEKKDFLLGLTIINGNWSNRRRISSESGSLLNEGYRNKRLNSLVIRQESVRYKSLVFAGSLSSVIPGSGKMYCNSWGDGFYSLILISGAALFTARSYSHNGFNTGTTIMGSLTALFYSANIYGSVKAARITNEKINASLAKEAKEILLYEGY